MFVFRWTSATALYALSLHDALPICRRQGQLRQRAAGGEPGPGRARGRRPPRAHPRQPLTLPPVLMEEDRKSTRLNSSHLVISYAVFCLKKKKKTIEPRSGRTIDITL